MVEKIPKVKITDIFKQLPKGSHYFLISNPKNIRYLTGFTGDWSVLILSKRSMRLYTDSRFTEQAENETENCSIITIRKPFATYLRSVIAKGKTVAFESPHIKHSQYVNIKKFLRHRKFVAASGVIERFRMKKTDKEIEAIQQAAKIADIGFRNICRFLRPGRTELEVAAKLEYILRKHGSSGHPFPTIALTSARTSLPHGQPGKAKIKKGDLFLIDFGATYEGYCSDMTRTVVIGKPQKKQKMIYDTVLRAQQAAIDAIKPGIALKNIDKIARDIIADAGHADHFGHGLGHGIGLNIHESPGVSPRSKDTVAEGMVFTVEPGIYIPGWGGVRIEDDIAVMNGEPRILTKSPKSHLKII